MKKPHPTSWESVARWYDELLSGDDTYQAKVIAPNITRLLPPQGKKILDIACGQGFFSKIYATGGADVLGIDISSELIKRAKEGETNNLHFEVSPANNISVAQDNSFDGALIVLALQNIKEMAETIKEAYRALKVGGTFIIVLNHPFFRIPQESSWGFDEEKNVQYRRVDAYGSNFSIDVDMTPGNQKGSQKVFTKSFHRPLQDYFKALSSAGFSVVGLEEWISHKKSEKGPRAKAEDTSRKEFPMFLTIVARK